ncbi:MAG: hypothetical protein E7422_05340 [Ruminococcaceae bacterium]|nr:hypothetical protein [Oscillospiraceae bacterium]
MDTIAKVIKYVLIGISVIFFPITLLSSPLTGILYGLAWLGVYNLIKKKKAEKQRLEQLNKDADELMRRRHLGE